MILIPGKKKCLLYMQMILKLAHIGRKTYNLEILYIGKCLWSFYKHQKDLADSGWFLYVHNSASWQQMPHRLSQLVGSPSLPIIHSLVSVVSWKMYKTKKMSWWEITNKAKILVSLRWIHQDGEERRDFMICGPACPAATSQSCKNLLVVRDCE